MSVRENLSRKFHPAGFEQPEGSRKNYVKPRIELQEAFDKWVDELPKYINSEDEIEEKYNKACKLIKPLVKIQYREANSLLVDFKPKTNIQRVAGLFISACYTHSPEDTIIFDMDVPEIEFIGYRTKKNIFNDGKVGKGFVCMASGLVVNNGECRDEFAREFSGLAVNNGNCGDWFALNLSGLAVNNGECGDWSFRELSGLAVNNGEHGDGFAQGSSGLDILWGLKSYGWKEKSSEKLSDLEGFPVVKYYIEELRNLTKSIKDEDSAKRFLEKYGPEPRERIEQDIKEILKKGGYKV